MIGTGEVPPQTIIQRQVRPDAVRILEMQGPSALQFIEVVLSSVRAVDIVAGVTPAVSSFLTLSPAVRSRIRFSHLTHGQSVSFRLLVADRLARGSRSAPPLRHGRKEDPTPPARPSRQE